MEEEKSEKKNEKSERFGNRGPVSTEPTGEGAPGKFETHSGDAGVMTPRTMEKPRSGTEARRDSTGQHDSMAAARRHQSMTRRRRS